MAENEEQDNGRQNDAKILAELKFIREDQKGIKGQISKLFNKIDEMTAHWEQLDKEFSLCKQNGDNETRIVAKEIVLIKEAMQNGYQNLNEKISTVSPESTKKKELEELEYKDKKWSIRLKWVKAGAWVFICLIVCIATATLVLHEKGYLDINKQGRIVPSIETNRSGR